VVVVVSVVVVSGGRCELWSEWVVVGEAITANVPLLPSKLLEVTSNFFNFSNLPKLLGISPVMKRNARETREKQAVSSERDVTGDVPDKYVDFT
jgi:hypothetical protein